MFKSTSKEEPKVWKGFGNLQIQYFFPLEFKRWFKNIKIKLFSTKSEEVLKRLEEAKKICDTKIIWLPKELFMLVVWVILGNNILIIIYEPDIILMRIKSEQVVRTFSNQFDYLWKKYKKDKNVKKINCYRLNAKTYNLNQKRILVDPIHLRSD